SRHRNSLELLARRGATTQRRDDLSACNLFALSKRHSFNYAHRGSGREGAPCCILRCVKQSGSLESFHRGRRHARYEVEAYADVTGDEVLLYHPIRDISAGGMRIETGSREAVGTQLEVLVCFPDQEQEVALAGEVVWADTIASFEVGLRWRFTDDESRELL